MSISSFFTLPSVDSLNFVVKSLKATDYKSKSLIEQLSNIRDNRIERADFLTQDEYEISKRIRKKLILRSFLLNESIKSLSVFIASIRFTEYYILATIVALGTYMSIMTLISYLTVGLSMIQIAVWQFLCNMILLNGLNYGADSLAQYMAGYNNVTEKQVTILTGMLGSLIGFFATPLFNSLSRFTLTNALPSSFHYSNFVFIKYTLATSFDFLDSIFNVTLTNFIVDKIDDLPFTFKPDGLIPIGMLMVPSFLQHSLAIRGITNPQGILALKRDYIEGDTNTFNIKRLLTTIHTNEGKEIDTRIHITTETREEISIEGEETIATSTGVTEESNVPIESEDSASRRISQYLASVEQPQPSSRRWNPFTSSWNIFGSKKSNEMDNTALGTQKEESDDSLIDIVDESNLPPRNTSHNKSFISLREDKRPLSVISERTEITNITSEEPTIISSAESPIVHQEIPIQLPQITQPQILKSPEIPIIESTTTEEIKKDEDVIKPRKETPTEVKIIKDDEEKDTDDKEK